MIWVMVVEVLGERVRSVVLEARMQPVRLLPFLSLLVPVCVLHYRAFVRPLTCAWLGYALLLRVCRQNPHRLTGSGAAA